MAFPRWCAVPVFALSLMGCTGHPPNTAVSAREAKQSNGDLREATPLTAIIRAQGVRPLDPSSPVPLLVQARAELEKTDPQYRYRGVTYNLTETNALDGDWIVQTPNRWGHRSTDLTYYPLECQDCVSDIALPACRSDVECGGGSCRPLAVAAAITGRAGQRVCLGHSDAVIDRIYDLVSRARQAVDIAVLQPPPDTRFLGALRAGIDALARSGRRVTVRTLVGQYPIEGGADTKALLAELIRDTKSIRRSRLSFYVSAMRSCMGEPSCDGFSWNHTKIIAVDGRVALVGGHNLWSRDYLLDEPVHDLSMQLRGPAAADASHFLDAMWRFVCDRKGSDDAVQAVSYEYGDDEIEDDCRPTLKLPPPAPVGKVSVLSVGRLAAGITPEFANQNDLARDLILGAARRSVFIVQQDIAFTLGQLNPLYPESTLERLADFLLSGQGDLYIVLSNPGAVSSGHIDYNNGVSPETVARKMRVVARTRSQLSDAALDELLCQRLHLAPTRFGPDATWADDKPIANHAKFWMVDDHVFYIGSDNLYPVNLQEFGYIVDDRAAAFQLRRSYWDPLWQWSKRAAISGDDAPRCLFRETPGVSAGHTAD